MFEDLNQYVNLTGTLLPGSEARVSVFDHGLLYGDGLFETLRVYGGRFFRLEAHLARLEDGARQLDLPLPWTRSYLAEALRGTVTANGIHDGAIRLTVTRGEGTPVPDPGVCDRPAFFITARVWSPPGEAEFEAGVSVCLAGRHPQVHIPGIKTLSFLPFQEARRVARCRGFDEGLLTGETCVLEGSTSNLFLVVDGELRTPGLDSGCLPGITRAAVLELAREQGVPCRECPVDQDLLRTCEEIFLTNSLQEILPVVRFEDRIVGGGTPGPLTRRLRQACQDLVRHEVM
jgi:branched-chain amino acid aminotransferase